MDFASPAAGNVYLAVVAALIIVYWAQWANALPERLPLARHPAALLVRAGSALWKNRTLVALFLVLGVGAEFLWQILPWARPTSPGTGSLLQQLLLFPHELRLQFQMSLDHLSFGLPSWEDPFWLHQLNQLLALALAVYLTGVGIRRPSWLAPGLQRRAPGAALMLWASVASYGWFLAYEHWAVGFRGPHSLWPILPVILLGALFAAPWSAFAFSLVLQIAAGKRWSLRRAVEDCLRAWPAFLLVQVLPVLRWTVPAFLQKHFALGTIAEYTLLFLIAAGFLVPWIILAESESFGGAVRRQVALWRARPADLGLFLLRYFTVAFTLGTVVASLRYCFGGLTATREITMLLEALWHLILAVVLARAYLEFRKLERAEAREATPAPPSVLPAEA